jgi:glycosyltransferase involved in cell wall biosynthesis
MFAVFFIYMNKIKISGFSFVRNAIVFGYPLAESVQSLLPICDEVVVAAGISDDGTIPLLKSIDNSKLRIIETVWEDKFRIGGLIYSQQTNIALSHCTGNWLIYLQADEALHESDYDLILREISAADSNPEIEALLFRYHHFYGSYDFIGTGRQWYRREIRAFKNLKGVCSWGDAQGFRIDRRGNPEKLRARQIEACIYHYGWVRHPKAQNKKILNAETYYHEEATYNEAEAIAGEFDYRSAYKVEKYYGSHPALMNNKIKEDSAWANRFDPSKLKKKPIRVRLSDWIEENTGYRIGEFKDFIEVSR